MSEFCSLVTGRGGRGREKKVMEGGLKESRGREGRMEGLEGIWFGLYNAKWRRIGRGEGG